MLDIRQGRPRNGDWDCTWSIGAVDERHQAGPLLNRLTRTASEDA